MSEGPQMDSIEARVKSISEKVNDLIEKHGDDAEGVENFQEDLVTMIFAAGLAEKEKWYPLAKVGCHPDNREQAMLVPIDVHELLLKISTDGWSYNKWDALASEVPRHHAALSLDWLAKNTELVKGADGLLAKYVDDEIEIMTARGSHGSAAVRCMLYATKGIHEDLCRDGRISQSKICERMPSMRQPLERGCPFTVIKKELVVACPRLMEVLSRTGNANHHVFRTQTMLQHCNRIHELITKHPKASDVDIAKKACVGMGVEFQETALKLMDFAKAWSGGKDKHVLKDLEAYERTMTVKRKLYPSDVQYLSKLPLDLQRYCPAMVKAMLNSPHAAVDSNGYSILFTQGDFMSVCTGGKNNKYAIDANRIMDSADTFLTAYGKMEPTQKKHLQSELEIRLVMHVQQKKSDSRQAFDSILEIADAMYQKAKREDRSLPAWHVISSMPAKSKEEGVEHGLRELRPGGEVADAVLKERGIQEGSTIVAKKRKGDKSSDRNDEKFIVIGLDEDMKNVTIRKKDDKDDKANNMQVGRLDLLELYSTYKEPESKCWKPGGYTSPTDTFDIMWDVWKGFIKDKLCTAFLTSAEKHVTIHQSPVVSVVVNKAWKIRELKLIGLSNRINAVKESNLPEIESEGNIHLGEVCVASKTVYHAMIQSQLIFPKEESRTGFALSAVIPFLAAYWAARETDDVLKANCEKIFDEVEVKCLASVRKFTFPTLVNTKPLKAGDELWCLKRTGRRTSKGDLPVEEPPQKRSRSGRGRGKGKGTK